MILLKNKICTIFIFFILIQTHGQSYANYPQDGVYGGIEAGVARVFVRGAYIINKSFEEKEYINEEYTKSIISVNLGYGHYIDESYIGIEAHHSIYTKKISDSYSQGSYEFNISIKSKSELDLIIGRKIGARSLLTLRGGIAFSNVDIRANNNLNTNIDYSLDKKWDGFSVGMGYVYGINDRLSIKSKYNLTTLKNKEYTETNSKFVDNRFSLSLIYRIWSR